MFKDSLKESMRNLLRRPVQSALAILGITCGIAGSLLLGSVGQGVNQSVMHQIDQIGPGLMTVISTPSSDAERPAMTLDRADADSLTADDLKGGISSPILQMNASVSVDTRQTTTPTIGVNANFPEMRSFTMTEGRFFHHVEDQKQQYVTVLGESLAKQLFPNEPTLGKRVLISGNLFQVVGVCRLDNGGQTGDVNNLLFVPIAAMQKSLMITDSIQAIMIKVPDPKDVPDVDANVHSRILRNHRWSISGNAITLYKQDQLLQSASSMSNLVGLFVKGSVLTAFLIGGIGVMNVMLMAAAERQHEIGVYLAFGATPGYIRWQFLFEATIISLLGMVSGILVGSILGVVLSSYGIIPWAFSWGTYLYTAVGGLSIGLLFGSYPSFRAAHVRPAEVLRK